MSKTLSDQRCFDVSLLSGFS